MKTTKQELKAHLKELKQHLLLETAGMEATKRDIVDSKELLALYKANIASLTKQIKTVNQQL